MGLDSKVAGTTSTVDFTTGAGQADLPPVKGDRRLHGWLIERLQEGDRINRADPAFGRANDLISDVMGDQPTGQGYPAPPGSESRRVVLNQIRKAINTHASMLTDIKPLWEWRTQNEDFKQHAKVFNDLLVVWWLRTFADLELANGIRYAATIGSSDILLEYDKNFNGGDMRMLARDWRDTVPIRPEKSSSIQDWEGVIFCEAHTAAKVRSAFPGSAQYITDSPSAGGIGVFTRFRKMTSPEKQQPTTLSGLGAKDPARYSAQNAQPMVIVYRAFFRDPSINTTAGPVLVGPPGPNWSYWVDPGKPLYPRGRHAVFTEKGVLWDDPNPNWHGRWPASRLSLQTWPWLMVGMPLAFDMRQLAGMLNITVNDILQVFGQWVHRGSIWGKNAPDSLMNRFDPTKPNWKVKVNQVVGTGFELKDGPNLPPWTMQLLQLLFTKWDELSGTANLTQLLQLRQSPSADTLDKYMEAMTPEIRMEARQVELFMRDTADMFLYNAAQWYSPERRLMILGESGQTLQDMDYDPGTMIPAMRPGQPGYVKELDANLGRDARAQFYLKQFGFYVAPASILAIHAQERKMMGLQLARQGYLDFWSLGELLEIPNLGSPPMMPLPKDVSAEEAKNLPTDPQTGQPMVPTEVRRPVTVTERLMAQQQLGLGQTVSAAGRKASGQAPPQMVQRPDGSTTVTES